MRSIFIPLDDKLIERVFQPLIDLAAARFGMGRTMLACGFLDAASLAWILARVQGLAPPATAGVQPAAALQVPLLLLGMTAPVSLRTLFRRAGRRRLANPFRLAMRPHRAVILVLLLARALQCRAPELADGADLLMLLLSTVALYLGACAERPPVRRSRIKLTGSDAMTSSG